MDITQELNTLSDSDLTELETRLKITPDMRIQLSKDPIYKLEKRRYIQIPGHKPDGLWYGFGDEWIDFTETASEEDTLGKGRCKCLFRHERDDIVSGLVAYLDKRRMDNIHEQLKTQSHEIDPIFGCVKKS
jgi:hypothetical protein